MPRVKLSCQCPRCGEATRINNINTVDGTKVHQYAGKRGKMRPFGGILRYKHCLVCDTRFKTLERVVVEDEFTGDPLL